MTTRSRALRDLVVSGLPIYPPLSDGNLRSYALATLPERLGSGSSYSLSPGRHVPVRHLVREKGAQRPGRGPTFQARAAPPAAKER